MNDVLKHANHMNIMSGLVKKYDILSIVKLVMLTYYVCINDKVVFKEKKRLKGEKVIFQAIGREILNHQNDIKEIFESLNILIESNIIKVKNEEVSNIKGKYVVKSPTIESRVFQASVLKIKGFSDESFMSEVIRNVSY